jgi:hypothetical protein
MIKLLFKTIFGICHVKSDGKNKNWIHEEKKFKKK